MTFVLPQILLFSVPKVKVVKEVKIEDVQAFAFYQSDIIYTNYRNPMLHVMRRSELKVRISHFKLDWLKEVLDLFAFESMLYVAVTCSKSYYYVLKFPIEFSECQPSIIYKHPIPGDGELVRMSKSLCGNIVLGLSRKIILLSKSGEVLKIITLPFDVFNAMQLDRKSYIVVSSFGICTVDDNGHTLCTYDCYDKCLKFIKLMRLAIDKHGNIFVTKYWKNQILVLDCHLKVKSTFDLEEDILGIEYDELKDILLGGCRNNKYLLLNCYYNDT